MADDKLQDDDLVKAHLRNHDRLVGIRSPLESIWSAIDERVNPLGAGAWNGGMAGRIGGSTNFDVTAVEGLDKFSAAMSAITVPFQTQYIKPKFGDKDLDKLPSVRRWCEYAGDRLYAIRYAPHTGFGVQAGEDMRQLGSYGTGPFWTGERKGLGIFYKALHLSEIWIDENFAGQVDTVHHKKAWTVREIEQQYGRDALTPKMRKAFDDNKLDTKFEVLRVVCPNGDYQPEAYDRRSMMVDSISIAVDEKIILRRAGFHSMPISVSRHVTGVGDIYGRSPAMKVLPTIMGVNAMARTNMRTGQRIADPAYAFYDDDGITSLSFKPGGANPGMVNERGQLLVQPIETGANLPVAMDMIEGERQVIRTAFLEDYFKLLLDDTVQRSATAVLEIASKQGVLVAPYASRYETEKQNPVTQRDLDLAMRAGQIAPFPPEVIEAGAYPLIEYWNPLARMARAEEAAGLTRLIETLAPMAQADPGVFDVIDTDKAAIGVADVLGVRPSWLRSEDEIAARRKSRSDAQQQAQGVDDLATAAGAFKDLAAGNAASAAA